MDSYFDLIRFNQSFGERFIDECQQELDKINNFHQDKLSEVSGKYKNLQGQLDNILSSAYNNEIQSSIYLGPTTSSTKRPIGKCSNANIQQSTSQNNSRLARLSYSLKHLERKITRNERSSLHYTSNGIAASTLRSSNGNIPGAAQKLAQAARKLSIFNISKEHGFHYSNPSNTGSSFFRDRNHYLNEIPPPSTTTQPISTINQSKRKVVAAYKKKIPQLKFAYRELYFSLVLFEQYTQLNYTGFEQILRKHDRMFASTLGRQFFTEHVQQSEFYSNLQTIDRFIEGLEHLYTLHFENGNRSKAIEKLQVPTNVYKPFTSSIDFRVGLEIGALAILFMTVLVTGFVVENAYDWRIVFRLYRSPLLLVIFLFQSGISIMIWKHYKINHVLIFELDPRNNLSYHHFFEFGALLGIIWSLSVLVFLFSNRLEVPPLICPLVVVLLITFYLFNPTATCHHQARFWLLRKLVS